ncbi:MAG: TetR/AcrR family transcriptional regulator [Coraliomargarita sp.]
MPTSDLSPRDKILNVAGELFHRRGYGTVSIEQIIRASQVTPATFHRYFNDKAELGVAWLERLNRRMVSLHSSFMDKLGPRETRLKKYFLTMGEWLENNGYRSCQFANTAASMDEANEDIVELVDQYKRAQHKFFIDLVKTIIGPKEARKIGTAVFLLFSGAMTEAQNLKAKWPLEDALQCAEELCDLHSDIELAV